MKKRAAQVHSFERHVFMSMLIAVVLLSGLYIFLISTSIFNVLTRVETEQSIINLHSQIGELESDYLLYKNAITLMLAHDLGFTDINEKTFVVRKSLSVKELSLNQ